MVPLSLRRPEDWEPGDMDAIKILEKSKEVENASTD